MANKKIDYDAIAFKNKDVDKFSTAFREKKDPLKQANITSARESTNVKTESFVRPSAAQIKAIKDETKRQVNQEREAAAMRTNG